jgi:hypothetical protein
VSASPVAYDFSVDRPPTRISIKPGKVVSALALIAGLAFAAFGLFVLLPVLTTFSAAVGRGLSGDFGLGTLAVGFVAIWLVISLGIAGFGAYNLTRPGGASVLDIETGPAPPGGGSDDVEARLRRLERLRGDGLVSQEEYERKRDEILRERW